MIKTGNCILILCFLFINVLFISAGQAQDISVSAVLSETNIFAGESVMLDVKVKGQSVNSIDRPQIPRVDGLRWLNNTTGQSTEY